MDQVRASGRSVRKRDSCANTDSFDNATIPRTQQFSGIGQRVVKRGSGWLSRVCQR